MELHRDRAVSLVRAHRPGVSILRAALATPDVDGIDGDVLPMADEDGDIALRLRTGDGHRALDSPQRIYGHVLQVVDGRVLDPVLSPFRAPHPVHPGEHAPLLVWWHGADQHRSDLDSAN